MNIMKEKVKWVFIGEETDSDDPLYRYIPPPKKFESFIKF